MMDMNIVKLWDTNKAKVQAVFEAAHPVSYKDVVRAVTKARWFMLLERLDTSQINIGM